MFLDNFAGDAADGIVTDTGVIKTLRIRIAFAREAERLAVFVEEIFLFETEPSAGVVENGRAAVARMRRLAIGHHDFAHDEHTVLAGGVRKNRHRFEHAIRRAAFRLTRRAAVKTPHRKFRELGKSFEFLDLRFAAKIGNGRITVQPDVF